jgi:hypothetical protein
MAVQLSGTTADQILTAGFLSGSSGPWTIMMWSKLSSTAATNKYVLELASSGAANQLSVIFGFAANKYEIFKNNGSGTDPRTNSDITPGNTNWHHIAWRKSASGASAYDKFLDGTKTSITASISFTLPTLDHTYLGGAFGDANTVDVSAYRIFILAQALSDADIAAEAAGTYAGPSFGAGDGFWVFSGTAGTDSSGNGNNFDNHGVGSVVTNPSPFLGGLLINPGWQGGMRPLMLGGMNG